MKDALAWLLLAMMGVALPCGTINADVVRNEEKSSTAGRLISPHTTSTNQAKSAVLGSIRLYQILLSSQDSPQCNFSPSCSRFGQEAVGKYGVQGLLMTSDRLLRCNGLSMERYTIDPSTGRGIDPVEGYVLWGSHTKAEQSLPKNTLPAPVSGTANLSPPSTEASSPLVDYYSPAKILSYANFLFDNGDYDRATSEYQRYLFVSGYEGAHVDSVRHQIGNSLRRAGNPGPAIPYFEAVFRSPHGAALKCSALRQMAYCEWDRGRYDEAIRLLRENEAVGDASYALCFDNIPLATSYLLLADWHEAHRILSRTSDAEALKYGEIVTELRALADTGINLEQKSPKTAALLSSLVPGAGKIWLGQRTDGILSLGTIALTLWLTIDGFQENGTSSVQGWFFGALTGGFYAGNIHGTAAAARNYNRANEIIIHRRASKIAFTLSFRL